eukprot:TRINITY_DN7591_c0_g1_i1.p1 TRINITY_DN7591_c0_g1~~TRINITY_DN7591_c0_g1_i1.p1  ORF type:complete len:526 (+),score=82.85 TRINITY_DN7591_c0_g1_i1:177-1754(+)
MEQGSTQSHFNDARDLQLKDLFYNLDKEGKGSIPVSRFVAELERYGIHKTLIRRATTFLDSDKDGKLTSNDFLRLKEMETNLAERALNGQLAIPDWTGFIDHVKEVYHRVEANTEGHVATYIPQLARVNPDQFGVAICTVDGQMWTYGDSAVPFTIQSCSKPITYCIAETERGEDKVKKHVGHEPSGQAFNAFILDNRIPDEKKPHNPMVNAGAIIAASLVQSNSEPADRFDYVQDFFRRLAGGYPLGFDNATYLSELRHADRNFALAYFMKDQNVFESSTDSSEKLSSHLKFYFQLCSITANTEQMAIVAASLAKGGMCPITHDQVFSSRTVKNCLSLMFACGMYDYSGEFAYNVGLPAKSGVAGCVYAVIPGLMGICVWSPRLDAQGNSARSVAFFEELTKIFTFHVLDGITRTKKINPRLRVSVNQKLNTLTEMIFAASVGDLTRIQEMVLAGVSVECTDYDGRGPLHLAANEGQTKVVEWLVKHGANVNVRDRWNSTPRDDALKTGHDDIVRFLEANGAEK